MRRFSVGLGQCLRNEVVRSLQGERCLRYECAVSYTYPTAANTSENRSNKNPSQGRGGGPHTPRKEERKKCFS